VDPEFIHATAAWYGARDRFERARAEVTEAARVMEVAERELERVIAARAGFAPVGSARRTHSYPVPANPAPPAAANSYPTSPASPPAAAADVPADQAVLDELRQWQKSGGAG
jgi:hypothetical protein